MMFDCRACRVYDFTDGDYDVTTEFGIEHTCHNAGIVKRSIKHNKAEGWTPKTEVFKRRKIIPFEIC